MQIQKMFYIKTTVILLILLCRIDLIYSQTLNRYNKMGQRTGRWVTYEDSSKTIRSFKGKYRKGNPVGTCHYYYNNHIEKIEKNRHRKIKTTFYYPNGIINSKGIAKLDNSDSSLHYYFYGRWKYFDEKGKLMKCIYYKKGQIIKTTYFDKSNLTNDSLILALNKIDRDFCYIRKLFEDSIEYLRKNPGVYNDYKKKLNYTDSVTFYGIDKILSTYGYPSKKIAGEASGIPFYILSFTPLSIKEKHLEKVIKAADEKELSWKSVAYFIDKIKVAKGEKQVYGTQYYYKNGEQVFYPIEDTEHLNERRKKVGLEEN